MAEFFVDVNATSNAEACLSGPLSELIRQMQCIDECIEECLDLSKMGRRRVPITDPDRLLAAAPEPSEVIRIETWPHVADGGFVYYDYTIRIGDRYQDRLAWDEALVLMNCLLIHPERFRERLLTSVQHCDRDWQMFSKFRDRLNEFGCEGGAE